MNLRVVSSLAVVCLLVTSCASVSSETQPSGSPVGPIKPAAAVTNSAVDSPVAGVGGTALPYPIVDTAQTKCYDDHAEMACSAASFSGEDAQYSGAAPHYQDNGDGTVSDLNTGLMWQADPGSKMTYAQAVEGASSFHLAGYTDWRLPSIKELFSLIMLDGTDVSACQGTCQATPFIDTRYFNFSYGDPAVGDRVINSQFATSTRYVSATMNDAATMFGVNFADGRIKGYPTDPMPGQPTGKLFYVLYVRGNPDYGQNAFVDNNDGSITDKATGLTWMQADSGAGMDWSKALAYCESSQASGQSDWRLPNVKELQSIVDYSRSPATSNSAAIDPVFKATPITDEAGQVDYPFYWTSTTHADTSGNGAWADYVAFGRALGYMGNGWIDVHGAGAQRSDPKSGDASAYPQGHGPQGDAVRVSNSRTLRARRQRGRHPERQPQRCPPDHDDSIQRRWPGTRRWSPPARRSGAARGAAAAGRNAAGGSDPSLRK